MERRPTVDGQAGSDRSVGDIAASTARNTLRARLAEAVGLRRVGDFRGAAVVLRGAIADAEATLGAHAAELVVSLNELGLVGKYGGAFEAAERAYRRAMAIHQRHVPDDDDQTAVLLHNLAALAHARGDAETAEDLARRGVAIRERDAANRDPTALAADRAALAAILIDLGRDSEARTFLEQGLAVFLAADVPDPFEIAVSLHNLGSLQLRAGEVELAAATLLRAAAAKREVLGPDHPDLAISLHNLARCLQRLGRAAAAERHLVRAVEILEPRVTATHPTLTACHAALAQPPRSADQGKVDPV